MYILNVRHLPLLGRSKNYSTGIQAPGSGFWFFFSTTEKQDPRQRTESWVWRAGWVERGGVSKSSGKSAVRKEGKGTQTPKLLGFVLLFFPLGGRWQLIRHNSWQSPAGTKIKMTLNSTSRRTGKGRRGVSGRRRG